MRLPRLSRLACRALLALLPAIASVAHAQQEHSASARALCPPGEPDSLQISWNTPCDSGDWLFEPDVGCRMWDWHPAIEDEATWTGSCKNGLGNGHGVAQWYEHGRPIDRFEGTVVAGQRQGPGRYTWNEDNWYVGHYKDDLPNGPGTALIAGETFVGQWRAGCIVDKAGTVAIGVPRTSCTPPDARVSRLAAPLDGGRQ